MSQPKSPTSRRTQKASRSGRAHVTLEDLVQLQFSARGFSLLPQQPIDSLLSGRFASRLRGRGLTFEELRQYRPGDDIRSIDWRATARLRTTHVRVNTEERDRPVLLVVDQRMTMFFGSSRTTKATAAAEAAALAAWRTIDRGDRIGAILFNDHEIVEIRPQRSRGNVLRICHELVRMNHALSVDNQTNNTNTTSSTTAQSGRLNDALSRAVNVASHDHLVLLVTDYSGDDGRTQELATHLAAHNDVLAIMIYDPLGVRLPVQGPMEATDGKDRTVVPVEKGFAERFELEFRDRCDQLRKRLTAVRIPILPICTSEPVPEQVVAALGGHGIGGHRIRGHGIGGHR